MHTEGVHPRLILEGWRCPSPPSSRPSGRKARRLAALRLPGIEPDCGAAVRPGGLGQDGDAALVLLIPATGEPRGLVHAIERYNLDHLPGEKRPYAGREQLARGLQALLEGVSRVAMEYSPGNAIPYVSRVDAGTVETVRQLGVEVVSSGDLVQRFEAVWTDEAFATHMAAAERLYRIKDRAFELDPRGSAPAARSPRSTSRTRWSDWFRQEGLVADAPPNVSAQENAGNPHYRPTASRPPRDSSQRGAS